MAKAAIKHRLNERNKGLVSPGEIEVAQKEVDLIRAQIADQADAIQDAIELLRLQSMRLSVELEGLVTARASKHKKLDLVQQLQSHAEARQPSQQIRLRHCGRP